MPEQTTTAIPEAFADYESWRKTGELPKQEQAAEEKPAETKSSEAPAKAEEPKPAPDSDPDKPQEQEGEQKHKGGFQRRIDKLTREKRELEAKVAELAAKPAEPKPAESQKAPEGKPQPEKFDTYEAYVEALTDWKVDQKAQAQRQAEQQQKQAEQGKVALKNWETSESAAREKHDDYDDAIEAVADIKVPPHVQMAILESDSKAELAYELAKHPEDLKRIVELSPAKAAIELGKIEARLTKTPEPEKPAVSRAPKPVTPVSGSKAHEPSITDENIAFADYERLRKAQLSRR